ALPRLAHPHRAMDGVVVEAPDHVAAEEVDRAQRHLLRLRRREHPEDELVATDVGIELHGTCALVGIADDALAARDALLQLRRGWLRDELGPRRHTRWARERVEVPEHQARMVAG